MDFESIPDFSLTFSPWTVIDGDGKPTYTFQGITFPHSGTPFAYIAFNPATTTPPITNPGINPHSGNRFGACFSATTPPNNDWFITPRIHLDTNGSLSLWVKSYTADYGLEKFRIGISVTDSNPSSFTFISGVTPLLADTFWTKKTFSLSAYNNQQVYIGIQCVSTDSFIFMIDDLAVYTDSNIPLLADFIASQTNIKVGDAISFTDNSEGTPTQWNWTFQGGTPATSNVQNPSGIIYQAPGVYDVTLTVSNNTGNNSRTKTGYISVTTGFPSTAFLDFESQSDFSLDFSPWMIADVNGGPTYTITGHIFPNTGDPFAYISFNPASVVPPMTDAGIQPHGGSRFGACISSSPPYNPNDKWLISPKLTLVSNSRIGFWCKTYNTMYGFERFNIGVSTTTNNPADFTIISGPVSQQAPIDWGYRQYSLNNYAGQDVYVAIQCVSDTAFIFMVDDIQISTNTGTEDSHAPDLLTVYPNPARDKIFITFGDHAEGIYSFILYNGLGEAVAGINMPVWPIQDLSWMFPGYREEFSICQHQVIMNQA